jgi:hypothetical protein
MQSTTGGTAISNHHARLASRISPDAQVSRYRRRAGLAGPAVTGYRLFFLGVTVTCDRCEQADVLIVSPLQPVSWKPRGLRCVSLLVEGGEHQDLPTKGFRRRCGR